MHKCNCWEVMGCGRELGGVNVASRGLCPAFTDVRANGTNDGVNGGRTCWSVEGTQCLDTVGVGCEKHLLCSNCYFFRRVGAEEGMAFVLHGSAA